MYLRILPYDTNDVQNALKFFAGFYIQRLKILISGKIIALSVKYEDQIIFAVFNKALERKKYFNDFFCFCTIF